MLHPARVPWWQRLFSEAHVPAYIPIRPDTARICPQCTSPYDAADRYCPGCHAAVPEWQFG